MQPSQFSSELLRIASKIDASKNPSPEAVARDLRRLVSALQPQTSIGAFYQKKLRTKLAASRRK